MAIQCEVCGKKPIVGHNVSHSNVKTKRRFMPNIQTIKALVAGSTKKVQVCTRCLKAGKVERAI